MEEKQSSIPQRDLNYIELRYAFYQRNLPNIITTPLSGSARAQWYVDRIYEDYHYLGPQISTPRLSYMNTQPETNPNNRIRPQITFYDQTPVHAYQTPVQPSRERKARHPASKSEIRSELAKISERKKAQKAVVASTKTETKSNRKPQPPPPGSGLGGLTIR